MTPTTEALVLKVISIDDLGVNIVELPAGTYLVNGEVVSHGGWNSYNTKHQISAKDVENIRAIHKRNILVGYVPTTEGITDDVLSVEGYNYSLQELAKFTTFDGADEEERTWNSLEDEFAYRKFVSQWKPKYKEEITYSEPLLIDRSHIRQDSGNPYIVAGFLTGRSDVPLYSYNRSNAVASMLAKKFESLGMDFNDACEAVEKAELELLGFSRKEGFI